MKPRVLVVDDEEKVARLLQFVLEQNGYSVTVEQDGLRAWEQIERDPPDLVLCDLLLPHLHGFEICKRVKSSEALKKIPVLLMTAVYKTTKYKSEAVTYGADDFLIKPVNQVELLASIRRFLQAEPAATADGLTEGFGEQLRMLRRDYILKLPERLQQLRANWEALSGGSWSAEGFRDLHRTVHGIAGTSATFGLAALSNAARTAEKAVEKIAGKGDQPPLQIQSRISALLEDLSKVAAQSVATETGVPVAAQGKPEQKLPEGAPEGRAVLVTSDSAMAGELQKQLALFKIPLDIILDASSWSPGRREPVPGALIVDTDSSDYSTAVEKIPAGRREGLPIVCLSRSTGLDARIRASQAGGTALVGKPVDLAELIGHLTGPREDVDPELGRVLILGRDELAEFRVSSVLEGAGMSTCIVSDPSEVMGPLSEFQADVLILDLDLPAVSAMELVKALRFETDHRHLPAIFFGSTPLPGRTAPRADQIDYFLGKPFHEDCLIELTRCCVRQSRAASRAHLVDSLTGLRVGGFWDAQEDDLVGARRESRVLSFAITGIDQLDSVNSAHGHAAGDRALAAIACLLQRRLRGCGRLGRLSGSSFGISLAGLDGAAAVAHLRQVCAAAAQVRMIGAHGAFSVTLSCGISVYPECGDAAALNAAARQALDAAKRQGGHRLVVAQVTNTTAGKK